MRDPVYEEIGDDGDEKQEKVYAWMKPNDHRPTDVLLLVACGRTRMRFKSQTERNRWKALQEKALGADDDSVMFDAWIKHNIDLAKKVNQSERRIVRTVPWVCSAIENQERQVDWVAANRERILQERAKVVEEQFFFKRK